MQADGKSRYKICHIPGNGYSPIYNISDDVAYVGMGTTMWRVSLSSGDTTSLGTFNGSGEMEIVDGQVYFHYGIEGAIRKVDASLADEGYFYRPLLLPRARERQNGKKLPGTNVTCTLVALRITSRRQEQPGHRLPPR